jgi:DNA modification methylase
MGVLLNEESPRTAKYSVWRVKIHQDLNNFNRHPKTAKPLASAGRLTASNVSES